jgi:hypothetical protein
MELMTDSANRSALRARGMKFIEKNNWGLKKYEYFDLVDRLIQRQPAFA